MFTDLGIIFFINNGMMKIHNNVRDLHWVDSSNVFFVMYMVKIILKKNLVIRNLVNERISNEDPKSIVSRGGYSGQGYFER